MPDRVGVLHAPNAAVGLRDIVLATRGWCDTVFVIRRGVAEVETDLVRVASALATVAVVDDDRITEQVAALGLTGLLTFHDAELEACDAALRALGLPGATTVEQPWDKLTQRRVGRAAGVSAIRAEPVDAAGDLAGAVDRIGLPAVLKPRRAAASVGLSFLATPAQVDEQIPRRARWDGLLLEQMIPGAPHPAGRPWLADYLSVETITHRGEHQHVAVFAKLALATCLDPGAPMQFAVRETGDVLPALLPPDVLAEALERTSRMLDALGVADRVSHTELKVSPVGLELIEVNGRLGGEVAGMVRLAGGGDMVRAAVEIALGHRPVVAPPAATSVLICVYVPFPQRDGLVRADVTRAQVRAIPGVLRVDEVARHGEPRSATAFHAAKVLVRADGPDRAAEVLDTFLGTVAELFAADGLRDDAWLRALRDGLVELTPAGGTHER